MRVSLQEPTTVNDCEAECGMVQDAEFGLAGGLA